MPDSPEAAKAYMRTDYADYCRWAREAKYGFMEYDRHLCDLVVSRAPEGAKLLEVACGTGFPFAQAFLVHRYSLYGVDIAAGLIRECRRRYPAVQCHVGDAEDLAIAGARFDATYCFHSAFFFPDVCAAVREMVRVTKPGGVIIFDVHNASNPAVVRAQRRRDSSGSVTQRALRVAKNLGKLVTRRGYVQWRYVKHEFASDPAAIESALRMSGAGSVIVLAPARAGGLTSVDQHELSNHPRIVYVAQVTDRLEEM